MLSFMMVTIITLLNAAFFAWCLSKTRQSLQAVSTLQQLIFEHVKSLQLPWELAKEGELFRVAMRSVNQDTPKLLLVCGACGEPCLRAVSPETAHPSLFAENEKRGH